MISRQITILLCALFALIALTLARPDSAGQPPLPGPGLSYGGIPYGSMSGNVAEYFKRQAPSFGRGRILSAASHDVDYAPIEQWL
uniref:Cuticular protein n=1 Tax=Papilio polytes TaxID=76194 RepID=I4DMQ5_PAPPL|nr:unknown secreted protein [Papilio polytes]